MPDNRVVFRPDPTTKRRLGRAATRGCRTTPEQVLHYVREGLARDGIPNEDPIAIDGRIDPPDAYLNEPVPGDAP